MIDEILATAFSSRLDDDAKSIEASEAGYSETDPGFSHSSFVRLSTCETGSLETAPTATQSCQCSHSGIVSDSLSFSRWFGAISANLRRVPKKPRCGRGEGAARGRRSSREPRSVVRSSLTRQLPWKPCCEGGCHVLSPDPRSRRALRESGSASSQPGRSRITSRSRPRVAVSLYPTMSHNIPLQKPWSVAGVPHGAVHGFTDAQRSRSASMGYWRTEPRMLPNSVSYGLRMCAGTLRSDASVKAT